MGLALFVPGTASPVLPGPMPSPPARVRAPAGPARDFDFLLGNWKVHNRRLKQRLAGSREWEEFEATSNCASLLDGLGNQDEYRTPARPGFVGMSLRFFDPASGKWSIYWIDNRTGQLQPPVVGGFFGETGVFEGEDAFEGRPIRVRYVWSRVHTGRPRWEQAFSSDGGKSWETNWLMDFTRAGEAR
jgi:hypothetical protein